MSVLNGFGRLVWIGLLTAWMPAHASFISPAEFGATAGFLSRGGTNASYDAASGAFASFSDPVSVGFFVIPDTYSFETTFYESTATVTNDGDLVSGVFNWTGQSDELGIAADTLLMSGTLTSIEYIETGRPLFQSVASIDYIDSALSSLLGDVASVLIYDFKAVQEWRTNEPWTTSFEEPGDFTTGPDFYFAPAIVSEPSTLALLGAGLLGFGMMRRRRA